MHHQENTANVFIRTCSILAISAMVSKVINAEEWPIVVDPFPNEIGPEPPPNPPTADCSAVCQGKIDEAMDYIKSLQNQLLLANNSWLGNIQNLQNYYTTLSYNVSTLEKQLADTNVNLNKKINQDVNEIRRQYSNEIEQLRKDLEFKIDRLEAGSGGDSDTKVLEVYTNLTQRIDGLENEKILKLMADNDLWRQNFRVVNATFAKLRKSNSGNNVILTG